MSKDDDDLINGPVGDDFAFEESDEFSIPETPYSDDDEDAGDDLSIDDMDFTVEASSPGDDADDTGFEIPDLQLGEEGYLSAKGDNPEAYEEYADPADTHHSGHQSETGHADEGDDRAAPSWGLWAGFVTFLIIIIGIMAYFVLPLFGGSNPANSGADPMASMSRTQQENVQGDFQSPTSNDQSANFGGGNGGPGESGNNSAPVSVSPFPVEDDAFEDDDWASEPTNRNREVATPIADPRTQERQPEGRFDYSQTRAQMLSDQAASELEEKMVSKEEFTGLRQSVRENLDQLDSLTIAVGKSEEDISSLNKRVAILERKIETGYQSTQKDNGGKASKNAATINESGISTDDIEDIQRKLADKNYRPGKIDGIFGSQTQWAVKRAQQEHGLKATGTLDAETREIIDRLKPYSGTYAPAQRNNAKPESNRSKGIANSSGWYLRGLTADRAIVYRTNGESYPVSVGTEVPGMGQVLALHPDKHEVVTAHGTIRRQ